MKNTRFKKKDGKEKFTKHVKPMVKTSRIDKNLLKLDRRLSKIEEEIELKHFDFVSNGNAFTLLVNEVTNPMMVEGPLNDPVQGILPTTRIGSEIICKKLDVILTVRTQTANITENRIRMWFVWYKGGQGSAPVPGEQLDLTIVNSTYAFQNVYFKETYNVISDKLVHLIPPESLTATTTVPDQKVYKFSIRLNRKVKFVAGAGTTPPSFVDILDNALYFGIATSAGSGAGNPQYLISTRCWYTDA